MGKRWKSWPLMLWAAPWSAVGVVLGTLALLSGGKAQWQGRALEFYGGWLGWLLSRAPIPGGAAAVTLGHTVLGRSLEDLHRCRAHEMVHVGQYERWGPFFIPAYFAWSILRWCQGRNAYRDNPFEVQAFATSHPPVAEPGPQHDEP